MSTGLCPHCLVGMYPAEGPDGHTWYCGDCGYETPRRAVARERRTDEAVMEIGGERMNGAGASTATAAPVPGPTWDRLARARLDVLIAAIGEVDALKCEAAVIHQALVGLGMANVPGLPWAVDAPVVVTGARGRMRGMRRSELLLGERPRYRTPSCVLCGWVFTAPTAFVVTREGSVCRSERLCGERRALREGEVVT